MRKNVNGFTLVELLIVVVVIAILAAISVVAYNGIQERAKISSVKSTLSQVHKKASLHHTDNGNWPTSGQIKSILDEVQGPNLATQSYIYCNNTSGDYALAEFGVTQPSPNNSSPVYYVSSEKGGVSTVTYTQTHTYTSQSICTAIMPSVTYASWYSQF